MSRFSGWFSTTKWTVWTFYLLIAFGLALWAQSEVFSIYADTSPPKSELAAIIKKNPGEGTFLIWQIFLIIYAFFTIPLASSINKLIIRIANVKSDDKETRTLARYITFAVIVGITAIMALLAVDYIGHSEVAEKKIRDDTNKEKKEAQRTSPAPVISLNIFNRNASDPQSNSANSPISSNVSSASTAGSEEKHEISDKLLAWPGKMGEHLGTFGDFFGGVLNPILTFGTLIALAFTILLQRIQLNEARNEAKRTSAHEQTIAFETTFFNMLNLHAENVKNLTFDPTVIETGHPLKLDPLQRLIYLGTGSSEVGAPVHGRAVFAEILRSTQRGATKDKSQKEVYRYLQNEHNDVLGHYFRHLYQILDHVDLFKIDGKLVPHEARKRYTDILRAQLSSHELSVLILNCARGMVDKRNFQDKLIDYEFLEHSPMILSEDRKSLSAKGISSGNEELFFEYLSSSPAKDDLTKLEWSSGAFGKNIAVCNFIHEQHSTHWTRGAPTSETRYSSNRHDGAVVD
jgi:hypothetical protein